MKKIISSSNKVHFTSLGCARNLVDTEVMLGILLRSGFEPSASLESADYLIVNTCGFLASARQEALDVLSEIFSFKKKEAKVIVAGCMVQKDKGLIQQNFPDVHYYLGSGDVDKVLQAIESVQSGEEVTDRRSFLEWGEVPRTISTPNHYAYLKIAEGCKKRCAFCIIPQIKGPLKSKTEEQVLKEFNLLLDQGVQEIILIAQDLGDYGKDRREKEALAALLRKMLAREGHFWIRLLYLYPDEITDELISLMRSDGRICPYLDMPLQHINDTILKAMHRKTSKSQIIETLGKLRSAMPSIVIRTSLMVGFPGETDAMFEELVSFIKQHPLDNIGIFKYSNEESAYSSRLPHQISEEVKESRFQILAKTQFDLVAKRQRQYLKKRFPVLIEGYHPESPLLMQGRFYGQCPEIDGVVIINDGRKVKEFGRFYEVEIEEVSGYDLIGRALGPIEGSKKKSISPFKILNG